ncbi:PadR family transcriptional regulator [Salinispira pacifica]|uniref:Transcriptional regulator, PadR family n=1 Tax=Salinispira pacifica TaxID=1307761 RepID=V5WNB9_9SPIO|nr:helix-turn-helix transcriptional regulator [Salinispira pacifica]AHC16729.1 Transcriptional regulator, PadR family [Salinispira pacifica]
MNPSKELVAASSVSLVLSILSAGDSYGYEIIKTVDRISGGAWSWSEGMLYPVLHKLEKNGWISSYWRRGTGNRRRKYYRLEQEGKRALKAQKAEWLKVHSILMNSWPDEEEL